VDSSTALAILENALARCRDEDVRRPELFAALDFLSQQAARANGRSTSFEMLSEGRLSAVGIGRPLANAERFVEWDQADFEQPWIETKIESGSLWQFGFIDSGHSVPYNVVMKNNGDMPKVKILTKNEGKKLLDRQARRQLNMSGDEFVRKWNAHEFADPEQPEIMGLAFLIPFGR